MHFRRFQEVNDHEGETWTSWLQFDGNEKELAKFEDLLNRISEESGYDLEYTLYNDVEDEYVVDKLFEYSNSGYNASHSKVTGEFICPDDLGEDCDKLYKSGINSFFV